MSLKTGPELVTSIQSFLDRDDLDANEIGTWVSLFEGQLAVVLRTRQMEKIVTSTIEDEYTLLPPDLLELRLVYVNAPGTAQRSLTQTTLENLQDMRRVFNSGSPTHYAIVGNQLEIGPVPKGPLDVRMIYFARIPALDLTTPGATNWLLTSSPATYFYGALCHSAGHLVEPERIAEYSQMVIQQIEGLNQADQIVKHSSSRLIARTRTFG